MSVESLKKVRDSIAASRTTWWLLLLAYAGVVLILLSPVLFASVGADDRYWILEQGSKYDGSIWQAFWTPLTHAFDFGANPRGTALAVSDRAVLSVLTMKIATTFAIPPMIVWAALKVFLFAMSIVAVRAFLRQVTFRDAEGDVRDLDPRSIAFITITLPITIAIGSKSQNLESFNGWNHYPPLTWGPFVAFFLFAALVLKLSNLLQRDFGRWIAPALALMVISGIGFSLSYELNALIIPISVFVLLLQPLASGETRWHRWRPKVWVLAPLLVSYTSLSIFIRWLMSRRSCLDRGTCYDGTVLQIEPRTLFNNFIGSLPGNNSALVNRQAAEAGQPFPGVGPASVALALLAVVLMWSLWAAWRVRSRTEQTELDHDQDGPDTRGLLAVLALALCIAVGAAVITGISARAVEKIETPLVAYRSGYVTWAALALAGVIAALLLMRAKVRPITWVSVAVLTAVITVCIAMYFPRNVLSAQSHRGVPVTQYNDALQLEVAVGDTSPESDELRCRRISDELERRDMELSSALQRSTDAAYTAFEFYHGTAYCSTGLGRSARP